MDTEKKDIKKPTDPEENTIFDLIEDEEEKKRFEPINPKSKKTKSIIGKVIGGNLNLREEPNREADVLKLLSDGKIVSIDEEGSVDGYYKVIVDNLVGFCAKEFIEIQ